jgi:hypothetical protein
MAPPARQQPYAAGAAAAGTASHAVLVIFMDNPFDWLGNDAGKPVRGCSPLGLDLEFMQRMTAQRFVASVRGPHAC